MAFWGKEVKPNKPLTLRPGETDGKLILTQATLGVGSSSKKSILQVNIGDESPVFLCSLLPEKSESCPLNLEFDEDDDVKFSVVGPTSVHISGFVQEVGHDEEDDYDSDVYREDIAEMESGDSEYDSEDDSDGDSMDSDDMMFPHSHKPNSGVVIEEIEDDEKPASELSGKKSSKKKKEAANSDNNKKQIVVKGDADAALLESEDEDGFPVSSLPKIEASAAKSKKKKKKNDMKDDDESAKSSKRKVNVMDQDEVPKSNDAMKGDKSEDSKNKKNKKAKADHDEAAKQNAGEVSNKKQDMNKEGKKVLETDKGTKQSKDKPSKVRNFPNGFVIEELEMGKPNGRRASRGKKVSVHYIGKLQKNGKVFDSNMRKKPFKFRLGISQVIKGWDVGVEGMRVGDKRRLTIPPSMGYGVDGAPPQIPPNAWLMFDVELVDVA